MIKFRRKGGDVTVTFTFTAKELEFIDEVQAEPFDLIAELRKKDYQTATSWLRLMEFYLTLSKRKDRKLIRENQARRKALSTKLNRKKRRRRR